MSQIPEAFASKSMLLAPLGNLDSVESIAAVVRSLHGAIGRITKTVYGDARYMVGQRLPGMDEATGTAQSTADVKRRNFTAEPTTPYDLGDLWSQDKLVKVCTTARASGAYQAGDWTSVASLVEVDDSTIEFSGENKLQVKANGVTAGHIVSSDVLLTVLSSFTAVEYTFALNNTWYSMAQASGAVQGNPCIILGMVEFKNSAGSTFFSAYVRVRYSENGTDWSTVWESTYGVGVPFGSRGASVPVAVTHTPTAGTRYYRVEAKVEDKSYIRAYGRSVIAAELKR